MTYPEIFAYISERSRVQREAALQFTYPRLITGPIRYGATEMDCADFELQVAFTKFAEAIYQKALAAREKYGFNPLGWATPDWEQELQRGLAEHVQKGDPRDVGVYAMFAWFHGWTTATPAAPAPEAPAAAVPGGETAQLADELERRLAEVDSHRNYKGEAIQPAWDKADTAARIAAYYAAPKLLARLRHLEAQVAAVAGQADGAGLIALERQRQITKEGYDALHDDSEENRGQLARAAACYAWPDLALAPNDDFLTTRFWPWQLQYWKPTPHNRVRELVKAGALIAAEIDRLQRNEERATHA